MPSARRRLALDATPMTAKIRFPHASPPAPGETMEVAPGILWIRLPLPMRLDHVNAYALDDGTGWTVVDTGFHTPKSCEIWEALLSGPLNGRPVHRVVLTHHHPDHIGMAGWLKARFDAEVVTTRTAWLMGRMLTLDVQESITPEALRFYTRAGMAPHMLEKRKQDRPLNFADAVHPIPLGYRRIEEGDSLQMGGRTWRVHIGHGHAPEHATFWSEDGELVLSGDQVLPGISPNLGVYPTEPEADTVGDWIESCTRLQAHATPSQLVLPGHKLPFFGLPTRLDQLIENHHSALARLLEHLASPRNGGECFMPLFKREIGEGEYGLALAETIGHLNHLLRLKQVSRTLGLDGVWRWTRL